METENRQLETGTMELTEHQILGMKNGSICPNCKEQKIIFRSWRDDFICGWCREIYKKINGIIRHLGNQKDLP